MKTKSIILSIVFAMFCGQTVCAQTTEGTEFWVTFMNNHNTPTGDSVTLKIIASARQDAALTVSNPQTGYSSNFAVIADSIAECTVPFEQGYIYNAGSVQKRGLRITSTAPVSLYASNFKEHTYDASVMLPVTGLGTDYVVQAYESDVMAKEAAVVATQDNTTVTITPHARTTDGKAKDVPFTVTLQAGETYMLMSNDPYNGFSGTRIQSDKAVAVFSGNQCVYIPSDNPWCDHIVEQQMPVSMWGKQFALTKTKGQNGDIVVITARNDNTEVRLNGTLMTTLQALQSYEFRLTDNSAFVETSAPAACYLYLEGAKRNNMTGDPASVHISPVEQRTRQLTFATFQTSVSRTHYANIVTTAAGAAKMMLDGKNISNEFSALTGNSGLRFARIRIPHGTHTLRTSTDGFTGHVYGLGHCESYAYNMGSATRLLEGAILVDGVPSVGDDDEIRCYRKPVTFSPQANMEFNEIEWDFGDGQKSTQQTVTHTYASPGIYQVEMRISNVDGRDTARTTLHLVETLRDTIRAAICEGETYTVGGMTFGTEGIHEVQLTSEGGCDSIITLYLSVGSTYTVNEAATFRTGSSYKWHNRWYREEGVYRDTLHTVHGCDSVVILTLTAVEATVEMVDTICWQPTYNFRDYDYLLPPIDDYMDRDYIDYTLEYFDKEACEHYRMDLAIIPKASGIYELNESIQEGQSYDFFGEQISVEGDYTKTFSYACDCEQVYKLHLSVCNFPITKMSAALCHEDSITFRGKQYTIPGVYYDTVFSLTGIDTVYEFTLSDNRSHTELTVSVASSYVFNGKTLTESGTYTEVFTNQAGCDSIVVLDLTVLSPATPCDTLLAQITIPEVCADDPSLDLQLEFMEGRPATYSLNFDAQAVAQGFKPRYEYVWNVGVSKENISIPIPGDSLDTRHYLRPDIYSFYIIINDECGHTNVWKDLHFKVHYPSWLILQRWNDLLSLRNEDYNGGYTFSSIRWFHEGMPVESRGEQGAYIYVTPNLAYGEAYWAELTRTDDGVTMTTCPFYPAPMTDKTEAGDIIEPFVTVTPTSLSLDNMTVTVQTNICGTYFIYHTDGNLLDRQPFCPPVGDGTFTIDLSPHITGAGVYALVFNGVEGTKTSTKIIVKP